MYTKDLAVLERFRSAVTPSGLLKLSAEEGNEGNYEKALSNIAHAYVQDIAPELLNYELGFQLIEKSEDNNRAVGIFGFKIGDLLLYVPIFFLNGEIKGLDLLYVYNARRFLSLDQQTIRKIISMADTAVGTGISPTNVSARLAYPNLMQLKPTTLKWAMDQPFWLRPIIPFYVEQKLYPSVNHESRTLALISDSPQAARKLASFLEAYPKWAPVLYDLYGDALSAALKTAAELELYPAFPKHPAKTIGPATLEDSEKPADVEIYLNIHADAVHKLSENELATLRRQGYLVKDRRTTTTVIRPKLTKPRYSITTVHHPNFYHLLLRDLSVVCAYVVPIVNQEANSAEVASITDVKRDDRTVPERYVVIPIYRADESGNILRRYDGRHGLVMHKRDFVATNYPKDEDKHSITMFESARNFDASDLKRDDPYKVCFFTSTGSTPPILPKSNGERMHRGLRVLIPENTYDSYAIVFDPELVDRIEVHKHFLDGKYDVNSLSYHVPTNAYFVFVLDSHLFDLKTHSLNDACALAPEFVRVDDVPNLLIKHADGELNLAQTSDGQFILNNQPYSKTDLFVTLIRDYNVSEKTAWDILDHLQDPEWDHKLDLVYSFRGEKPKVVVYKKAQDLPMFPNSPPPISSPPLPMAQLPTGLWGNQRAVTINEGFIPLDTSPRRPMPAATEPLEPQPLLDQMLSAAIQTGQKEVLDTTVFSNLLHATDDKDIIEKHLPGVYTGLDALGRILFNMYMHHDVFEQRFGKDRLEDLEQSTRNVFKGVGKLVMDLQKRPALSDSWAQYRMIMGL